MLSMVADGGPETEGAIHMHPCTHFVRKVTDLTDRIAGASIPLNGEYVQTCLSNNASWSITAPPSCENSTVLPRFRRSSIAGSSGWIGTPKLDHAMSWVRA